MKRFEFRLAPVLRLRRTAEDAAKAELATANRALRAAIAERDAERVRVAGLLPVPGTESFETFQANALAGTLSARSHAAAQALVAQAAASAAMAQIAWTNAARKVAVLERLSDRRHAEHVAAQRLADAAELDDIVNSRHAFEQSRHTPGAIV
jgi:flagellar export protein FliJ